MHLSFSSEKTHVKELTKGSYAAFDALYSLYARRLYGFAFKLTKSSSEARDIVQETFVKLWIHRENVDPAQAFQSYLFSIAKNSVINRLRATVNAPAFVDYLDYVNEQQLAANGVPELIHYDDFRKQLDKAKTKLSKTQCSVFELSKEHGFSHSEIAQYLNISEQTVRNQLSAALKVLRLQLREHAYLFALFFL